MFQMVFKNVYPEIEKFWNDVLKYRELDTDGDGSVDWTGWTLGVDETGIVTVHCFEPSHLVTISTVVVTTDEVTQYMNTTIL